MLAPSPAEGGVEGVFALSGDATIRLPVGFLGIVIESSIFPFREGELCD